MESESTQKNWSQRPISNSVGLVPTIGINAVTIRDSQPYFFLFSDIDSTDTELLKEILKIYRYKNLSVYFYRTTKGWHVISPVLMNLRSWVSTCNKLRKIIPDYSFDSIRYDKRQSDGIILHFESWNWKNPESYDLHYLLRNKFKVGFDKIEKHYVSTKLQWCTYNQLRITKKCHY